METSQHGQQITTGLQPQSRHSTTSQKPFSILPDLITGWKPKSFHIPPPILVKYKQDFIKYLIMEFNQKIVYLGHRHYNSFSFHNEVQHDYHVRYGIKSQDLPLKLQQQIQKYQNEDNRPFSGMRNNLKSNCSTQKGVGLKHNFQFDSSFQSGNLDLVMKVSHNEYDLFLRPDTNTCGHTQWFYFKIKSNSQNKQTIKLNICNNRKPKTLYSKGMKPYIYSKKKYQQTGVGWHQDGKNVTYKRFVNAYVKHQHTEQQQIVQDLIENSTEIKFSQQENTNNQSPVLNYYCLSFQYEFSNSQDQIYFAYCPPYTYSQLRKDIGIIKKKAAHQEDCSVNQEKLCISLSGVQVPLLTITDLTVQEKQKKIIVATARIHPGQSNSSHVMHGFLDFLVSSEAKTLRQKCIFKVIPMMNPDGVILGNFRTGLAGKDLNRQFKTKNTQLLPEIIAFKEFIRKLKFNQQNAPLYYFDFHGHSSKKNVFVYGPDYQNWDLKYQRSKILSKLLASITSMFKINSCVYKVANYKKSTARAFVLSHIPYSYTLESSIGSFKDRDGQNIQFNITKWNQMGNRMGNVLGKCFEKLQEDTFILMRKQKKKRSMFQKQVNTELIKTDIGLLSNLTNSLSIPNQKSILDLLTTSNITTSERQNLSNSLLSSGYSHEPVSLKSISCSTACISSNKSLLQPIRNLRARKQITLQFPKINEQNQQNSDQQVQTDDKSDCQSEANDLDKKQYQLLSKDIFNVIESFKSVVKGSPIHKNITSKKLNYSLNKNKSTKKNSFITGVKSIVLKPLSSNKPQEMKLVPSLKHKLVEYKRRQTKQNAKITKCNWKSLISIKPLG